MGEVPERSADIREGGKRFQERGAAGTTEDDNGEQGTSGKGAAARGANR